MGKLNYFQKAILIGFVILCILITYQSNIKSQTKDKAGGAFAFSAIRKGGGITNSAFSSSITIQDTSKKVADTKAAKKIKQNVNFKKAEEISVKANMPEDLTPNKPSAQVESQNTSIKKKQVYKKPNSGNNDKVVFIPYDGCPSPIGGFAAIQKNLYYPEIVRKAGIGGTVIVYAKIGKNGDVINTKVVKPLNKFCDEAAEKAIKSVKWKPATQKGKPVTVWISVPIKFGIKKDDKQSSEAEEREQKPQKHNSNSNVDPNAKDSYEKISKEIIKDKQYQNAVHQRIPEDQIVFVPYTKAPEPIGGFAAIQKNLRYPEIARRAGIEGTVIVYTKIDKNGDVIRTKVVKSLSKSCDEAAIDVVKSTKWKPAKQKGGKPVTVWVSIPIEFKLK